MELFTLGGELTNRQWTEFKGGKYFEV